MLSSGLSLLYLILVVCTMRVDSSKACVLKVGILGNFSSTESEVFSKVEKWLNSNSTSDEKWRIKVKVFSVNATSNNQLELAELRFLWKLEGKLTNNKITVLIGPSSTSFFHLVHPIVVFLNIYQILPQAVSVIYDDKLRFPNLLNINVFSRTKTEALWSLVKYYKHTNLTLLTTDDVDGLNIMEHVRSSNEKQSIHMQAMFIARVAKIAIQKDESLKRGLQEVKEQEPHAVYAIAPIDFTYAIITKALYLNMTPERGWLWIVDDDVTMRPPRKTITKDNITQYFNGVIGFRESTAYKDKLHRQLDQYLALHFNSSDVYKVYKYFHPLLTLSETFNTKCDKQNKTQEFRHRIPSKLAKIRRPADSYDVICTDKSNWLKIGRLNPSIGLVMNRAAVLRTANSFDTFFLRITTIVEPPFVFRSPDDPKVLKGYCIDLLEKWSKLTGFSYSLNVVTDGQYGGHNKENNSWNGMIGEVERDEADIAIGSITITESRAKVGNFLPAFMDVGLKFLIQRYLTSESAYEYSAYAFLHPFEADVYQVILLSVALLSIYLTFVSKLSPFGIRGRFFHTAKADHRFPKHTRLTKSERKLREEKRDASRGMGLNNALYFVWAALFWQTPERVPRSISARIITVTWYLVAVILVASYTANLAGVVLRHNPTLYTINSIEDLLLQAKVGFGTVASSAVETQLETSRSKLGGQLFKWIEVHPDHKHHVVPNVSTGVQLVKDGIYALLWDSISLDYIAAVQSNCALKTVDVGFGAIQYAFFIQKNSTHYKTLSDNLEELKNRGFLKMLWRKYFLELGGCSHLDEDIEMPLHRLTVNDLAGVFYFVYFAMGIGIVVLILEWYVACFYDVDTRDVTAPQSIREAFHRRRKRLWRDMTENWNPLDGCVKKRSKLVLPSLEVAEELVKRRISSREFSKGNNPRVRRSRSLER